jgi:hypothetical protein
MSVEAAAAQGLGVRGTIDPVFVLAPPCSSAAILGAMLGQHPQMYDLPELHLFLAETVADWWRLAQNSTFHMEHGLLRVVAQLFFGAQTEANVQQAKGWLRRRLHFSTGLVLEMISEAVFPSIVVYTSSSIVRSDEFLDRARQLFWDAKFIFVSEHPVAYCRGVLNEWHKAQKIGPIPDWLLNLAVNPEDQQTDPQWTWRTLSKGILDFMGSLPGKQRLHIRFEDLVANPELILQRIVTWLDLETGPSVLASMQHPERSIYARFGPNNALYGNNPAFLSSPCLSNVISEPPPCLHSPLTWRADGQGFSPDVLRLAETLGYS